MKGPCVDCGLYLEGCLRPHIPSQGSENPDILFVGEAPGREEDEQGIPFVGKSGKFLREVVSEIFRNTPVRFTNLCRCRPPDNLLSKKRWIRLCAPEVEEEIEKYKPKLVCLLGAKASEYFGVRMNTAGVILRDGVGFISTFHPSYVVNYGGDLDVFIRQLGIALRFLNGEREGIVESEGGEEEGKGYCILEREEELDPLVWYFEEHIDKPLAYDVETSGLSPYEKSSKILSVALTCEVGKVYCVPLGHYESNIPYESGIEALRNILEKRDNLIAHNIIFDRKWLRKNGVNVKRGMFDTMLAHFLLYPDKKINDLKNLCVKYGLPIMGYEKEIHAWMLQHKVRNYDFSQVPLKILGNYNCGDADAVLRLYFLLDKEIEGKGLRKPLEHLLMEATELIEAVENAGCYLDIQRLKEIRKEVEAKVEDVKRRIFSLPEVEKYILDKSLLKGKSLFQNNGIEEKEKELNLNSVPQLREVVYKYCGLPGIKTTPKGELSVSEDVLKDLSAMHPFPALILELRQHITLLKMFLYTLDSYISDDGYIHPSFNLHGARSGRLSSDTPNLQQIPRRGSIRSMFISRFTEGLICNADFSQIELRVLACVSGDRVLQQIFKDGKDLHTEVAAEVFNVELKDVTKEMRNVAKAINFGIVYGRGAKSLVKDIGGNEDIARQYIDRFFNRFSRIKEWRKEVFERMMAEKLLTTVFGRRREFYFPSDNEEQFSVLNEGANYLIQSPASDMNLISAIYINKEIQNLGLRSRIIGLIHDAILFDVYRPELKKVEELCNTYMGELWNGGQRDEWNWVPRDWISVPILYEFRAGSNWEEAS